MANLPESRDHKLDTGLKFESFLIAFCDGSTRARKIVNILTITSIAALLALLNSLSKEWNWFPSRQEKIREVYEVLKFNDDSTHNIHYDVNGSDTTDKNDFEEHRFRELLINNLPPDDTREIRFIRNVSPWVHFRFPAFVLGTGNVLDREKLKAHKKTIIEGFNAAFLYPFVTRGEMNRMLQAMNRAKLENSTFIRIPILGIAFDVNWLSIISGLGFISIYLLLYYSLGRERKNIILLFKIAVYEKISVARIYQFMSMQQVFTVPQSIDEYLDADRRNNNKKEGVTNKIKRLIPKIFWSLPFVLWLAIFMYDIRSREIGMVFNSSLTGLQMKFSILIGSSMLLLTVLCFNEYLRIDNVWRKWSKIIKKQEKVRRKNDRQSDEGMRDDSKE